MPTTPPQPSYWGPNGYPIFPPGAPLPGGTKPGEPVPDYPLARPEYQGTSRRGLITGAAAVGVAVVGGGAAWLVSSQSKTDITVGTGGTGNTPQTDPAVAGAGSDPFHGAGAAQPLAWKFVTSNPIQNDPGVGNGVAYVVSGDNILYAISLATHGKLWARAVDKFESAPGVVGSVVCGNDIVGHFYAYHTASGAKAWDLATGNRATWGQCWAVDGTNVILAEILKPVQAYDAATGAKGTAYSVPDPVVSTIAVADGILYALGESGNLFRYRVAGGAKLGQAQAIDSGESNSTGLVIADGTIYFGIESPALLAIDAATGKHKWSYQPGSQIFTNPVVANGLVYVREIDGPVHAISAATGKQVWSRAAIGSTAGLAVAGGRLYYPVSLSVQAVDAKTGTPIWAFSPPNDAVIIGAPAVANGLVFVGARDHVLYAIKA
jgi:outer membrane protein assembly factor BamB